ncbi:serine hydrolase [Panacibacter sp. KCS-6]|uniref:Serine hydrolase n=2 Tax=Limnovirga soli TaxID=2656915 RepID=A0A8J8FIK4_9BACT|nr:serine hydrolase [Limnovirga soli]
MAIQVKKTEIMSQKASRCCMKVSTVLVFLLLLQAGKAQYNFSGLDSKLSQYQKQLGGNVATLIYKNGAIIYNKSLGDFTATTPAPIASCSKWLTAALVMQFVDEGKLSLDDYVSKYLPIFKDYGKGYITIRQCLSHTTGIEGDPIGLAGFIKLSRYKSLADEVDDFAAKHNIQDNPGVAFRYSTIGLNIAARVLEVISKRPFDKLMLEKMFRPLNMKNSSFTTEFERAVNPSGGCRSTAMDYMNFLSMLLNKGMFNGKRILSENAINTMQQAITKPAMIKYTPPSAKGYDYALGEWVLATDEKGKSTIVSSPGLFGTWPYIDIVRGYAAIFFVKNLEIEQRQPMYTDLRNEIEQQILPLN